MTENALTENGLTFSCLGSDLVAAHLHLKVFIIKFSSKCFLLGIFTMTCKKYYYLALYMYADSGFRQILNQKQKQVK